MPIITITEESLDLVDIQTLCPLEGEVEDAPVTSTTIATASTTASTTAAPTTAAPTATTAISSSTAATGFASYFPSFMLPTSSSSSSTSTTPIIPPPSTSTPPSTAVTVVGTSIQQQQQQHKQQRLTKTAKTKRLTQFQSFLTQLTRLDETILINYQAQLHPDYTATTYSSSTNSTNNSSYSSHAVACILISYIKHKRIQTLFDQLPMNTTNTNTTTTTAPITGTLPNSYLIPADVAPLVPPALVTYLRSSEVHSI